MNTYTVEKICAPCSGTGKYKNGLECGHCNGKGKSSFIRYGEPNIVDRLIIEGITDNEFHASNMLNVLQCVKLETDDQRLDRCRLYLAWQEYFKGAKAFTSIAAAKRQARANAIAGKIVPELPMLEALADDRVVCPVCEKTHRPDEVQKLGSGIRDDNVNWSEWLCLLTGVTWLHSEPVPAQMFTEAG